MVRELRQTKQKKILKSDLDKMNKFFIAEELLIEAKKKDEKLVLQQFIDF